MAIGIQMPIKSHAHKCFLVFFSPIASPEFCVLTTGSKVAVLSSCSTSSFFLGSSSVLGVVVSSFLSVSSDMVAIYFGGDPLRCCFLRFGFGGVWGFGRESERETPVSV